MDDGYYNLVFQNAETLQYFTSDSCKSMSTSNNFYNCIKTNYRYYCGGNPTVNATFYDTDGYEVDAPVEGGSGVYYVEAVKLLENQCSSSITAVKSTSSSDIVIDLSKDVQLSGKPLGGKFFIECTDPEGYLS
jgi:hypothetical protein